MWPAAFLLSILCSCLPAGAELFRGPMSAALGGAGIAGMPGAEAAFLNPALIPLFGSSALEAYFRDGSPVDGQHSHAFGLGAIDTTRDVLFPGTLHYLRLRDTGRAAQPSDGELWHAGIGQRNERFSLGVSGFYLQSKTGGRKYTQVNFSLGAVYMIDGGVGVAYVLKNLAQPGSDVPASLREEMQQGAGAFLSFSEHASLRLDILRQERFNPRHKMVYLAGFESKTSDVLAVRLGYRYDDLAAKRVWTFGLGFDGPRLKLDYAFEKQQERASEALHSVDLRLVF